VPHRHSSLTWPRLARGFFSVPSMIDSFEVKSSIQPDGGEGLAKRKGVVARRGLKEAWSKVAAPDTRPTRSDERADDREVHGHQGLGVVNPAGVRRRRSVLPREILTCPGYRTERVARLVIAAEKSAEDIVGGAFDRKPERLEVATSIQGARVGTNSACAARLLSRLRST
jgi:hypothetical protein